MIMKSKQLVIFVFMVLLFIGCKAENNNLAELSFPSGENENSLNILFIGSSYFDYNNLPELFSKFAEKENKNVNIETAIQVGLYLSDHVTRQLTLDKINAKKWDYVILQGVGSITAYPEYYTQNSVVSALSLLQKKIINRNNSTKIIFCMPWAFEDGMIWKKGWTDKFPEMQKKIYDNTLQYSKLLNIQIAPVGWVWGEVLKEKNYPLHYLHLSDWNHPSIRGTYLMASTIYSSIFKEKPSGNKLNLYISDDDSEYFQTISSSIVLGNREVWNIKE